MLVWRKGAPARAVPPSADRATDCPKSSPGAPWEAVSTAVRDQVPRRSAAPAPGISEACFSAERERFGPGDHKIWYTSKISSGSIGRGWSIPTDMIAPPVLEAMNELAGKLGYVPVDEDWGNSAPPADLRLPVGEAAGAVDAGPPAGPAHSQYLGARLRDGLERANAGLAARWEPHGSEIMVAVSIPADPHQPAEYWQVDLKNRVVSLATSAAQEDSDWDVIGSAAAWEQVIEGNLNLSVALRAAQLRYCDGDDPGSPVAADTRIAVLADLLGLAQWSGTANT